MADPEQASAAMIATYVPRRCGIATFTHDLSTAVTQAVFRQPLGQCPRVGVVAMNDLDEGYTYGPEVVHEIRDHSKADYHAAADFLNHSKYDVVCVQHEYGIFGGTDGEYLLALTDRLTKPVVTTTHTVLAKPSDTQREILAELCDRSSAVVVMAQRARRMLGDVFGVASDKVHLIHHGVPDVPYGDTARFKSRFDVAGRPVVLTFGLLSPNKGIETMLDALAAVVRKIPNVAYIVLGATHPGVRRDSGESYRLSLEKRALDLKIEKNVLFHNRYVSLEDLCEYLQATDVYVTPYRQKEQITSGTLAYAAACGTAVVSTPYWYAEELLDEGRGRLVDFGDAAAMAESIIQLLCDDTERQTLRRRAYDFGRRMIWSHVGKQYGDLFTEVLHRKAPHVTVQAPRLKSVMRLSLPEVRLDHLYRMTDDTGLMQHGVHATPDRHHGYSIDDVARGLIVAAMRYTLFRDDEVRKPFHTYLSYVHYAKTPQGRYRNFMAFDRQWREADGSDDAQGRVLWALGYVVAHPPDEHSVRLCEELFDQSIPLFEGISHLRAQCFAILGCHYYLRQHPEATSVRLFMRRLADEVAASCDRHMSGDWPWFEDVVTYENARLPQALIIAGCHFNDNRYVELGLKALDWLLISQTAAAGHISLIGNNGWWFRNGSKARFDQQPVEIAALIGACKAAYRARRAPRYLGEMRRCFEWFLGANDVEAQMIDFKSRGCYDGITPSGVNLNQGAESLLSWLLSLLIMHEMQTGDPNSIG